MSRLSRYGIVEEGNKIIVGKGQLIAKRYHHHGNTMPFFFNKGSICYYQSRIYFQLHEVEQLVNFYDVKTKKLINEGKKFSTYEEYDETGYSNCQMFAMLNGSPRDGMIAEKHFFLVSMVDDEKAEKFKRILEDCRQEILEKGIAIVEGDRYEIKNVSSDFIW